MHVTKKSISCKVSTSELNQPHANSLKVSLLHLGRLIEQVDFIELKKSNRSSDVKNVRSERNAGKKAAAIRRKFRHAKRLKGD
jgi:hypothetical protein